MPEAMPKYGDGNDALHPDRKLRTAVLIRHQDRELFAQTIHKVFIHRDVATKKKKKKIKKFKVASSEM